MFSAPQCSFPFQLTMARIGNHTRMPPVNPFSAESAGHTKSLLESFQKYSKPESDLISGIFFDYEGLTEFGRKMLPQNQKMLIYQ